jgi:zinc protease
LDVWIEMLTRPGFDSAEVAAWRGRQMESVRRRDDDPARLAFSEFNRLMYGDHPIGWELGAVDLSEDRVSDHALRQAHRRVVCRDNLILGVSGDLSWTEAEPRLERLISSVPACSEPLPEPPSATVRRDPGIFVIDRELEQAVVVLGQATEVRLADQPDYFAAMLGNSILGAGGFSSRLMGRVRTQEGFAYSVSSLWTTPRRYPGLLGAVTRTRPDRVVETLGAILETMDGLTAAPPTEDEVGTTVDQTVNGFIFNFDRSAEIVARNVYYLAQDLPDDWLERYVSGIQAVTSEDVWRVFRTHMRTSEMTVLIVGDASRIGLEALGAFGRVTELRPR